MAHPFAEAYKAREAVKTEILRQRISSSFDSEKLERKLKGLMESDAGTQARQAKAAWFKALCKRRSVSTCIETRSMSRGDVQRESAADEPFHAGHEGVEPEEPRGKSRFYSFKLSFTSKTWRFALVASF